MKVKYMWFVILGTMIFISFPNTAISSDESPAEIVKAFFNASVNGDVIEMKKHISGAFYRRRRVLLEKNTEYADYLKNYYSGMTFSIVSSDVDENLRSAKIVVKQQFNDVNSFNTTLLLEQESDGTWKINDEIILD